MRETDGTKANGQFARSCNAMRIVTETSAKNQFPVFSSSFVFHHKVSAALQTEEEFDL